jgi:hypothetical protein
MSTYRYTHVIGYTSILTSAGWELREAPMEIYTSTVTSTDFSSKRIGILICEDRFTFSIPMTEEDC